MVEKSKEIEIERHSPLWIDKRFLQMLIVTLLVLPSVAAIEIYGLQPTYEDLTWTLADSSMSGYSVRPMAFTTPNEFDMVFNGIGGLYYYHRENLSTTGPIKVDNTSWVAGAYDIEPYLGGFSHFYVTGKENGSVYQYTYSHQTNDYQFMPFLVRNITQEFRFEEVEFYHNDDDARIFLGDPSRGLVECNFSTHQSKIITAENGLPSNGIRCLQIRGDSLLVGTSRGFAFINLETGMNFTYTTDELGDHLIVDCIEYYQFGHKIYVGTEDGLFIFQENGTRAELLRARLTTDDGLSSRNVNAFAFDKDEKKLYIGTYGGLSYIDLDVDDQSIVHMISREQLTLNYWPDHVLSILIPETVGRDYIYLGTMDGYIIQVPKSYTITQTSQVIIIRSAMYSAGTIFLVVLWLWYTKSPYSFAPDSIRTLSIQELIELKESRFLEFKQSLRWDHNRDELDEEELWKPVLKIICGFMNAEGGTLLIGVSDLGEIIGLEKDYVSLGGKKDSDRFEMHLTNLFKKVTGGGYRNLYTTNFKSIGGKEICRIDVKPAPKPILMKEKGKSTLYVREGGSTRPYDMEMALRYREQRWK